MTQLVFSWAKMQANFQTDIRHNTISHRRSKRLKLGKPSQGQCDPFLLLVLPVEHSSVLDLWLYSWQACVSRRYFRVSAKWQCTIWENMYAIMRKFKQVRYRKGYNLEEVIWKFMPQKKDWEIQWDCWQWIKHKPCFTADINYKLAYYKSCSSFWKRSSFMWLKP